MGSSWLSQRIFFFKNIIFYKKLICKKKLCFDIGANVGDKSKIFLLLNAKVIAFEPLSKCHPFLKKIEKKYPNFKFIPVAVGSKNELKELNIGSHIEVSTFSEHFMKYFKNEECYWMNKETVEVRNLNSLIEEYGIPHYCKIDVEGFELEIIKKLSYKIPIIEFEFTGGFIDETFKIIEKLATLGHCSFNYILNENPKFQMKQWVNKDEIQQVIKSLPIQRLHGNIFVKTI